MGKPPDTLRIHDFQPASRSNGPGWRSVIWVQGCTLGCPECFNPLTHPAAGGQIYSTDELAQKVIALQSNIEGITISGGEPLQQHAGLLDFLGKIKQHTSLSVLLFSGYTWEEIRKMPFADSLIGFVDVLIAGRYISNQRIARGLIGSKNKSIHFLSQRYSPIDIESVPETEVIFTQNGEIVFSGINPAHWSN